MRTYSAEDLENKLAVKYQKKILNPSLWSNFCDELESIITPLRGERPYQGFVHNDLSRTIAVPKNDRAAISAIRTNLRKLDPQTTRVLWVSQEDPEGFNKNLIEMCNRLMSFYPADNKAETTQKKWLMESLARVAHVYMTFGAFNSKNELDQRFTEFCCDVAKLCFDKAYSPDVFRKLAEKCKPEISKITKELDG